MDYEMIIKAFIAWNIFVFALFGLDKYKAARGRRRISEKTLLLCSFLMGSAGGLLGMGLFRHKTKHLKFKLFIPLALGLNALVYWFLIK